MSMTNANRDGFKKTINFNFGVFAGFVVIMLACSYFNLLLFHLIPRVKIIMAIIGSAYMIYLAYKIYTSKHVEGENDNTHMNSFLSGFMLQFVNPKVILYGITTVSTFIVPFYKSVLALTFFTLFLAFVGFVATCCWSLFGSVFQRFLVRNNSVINFIMALLLVYCAVSLFL
jgi:threonine/homoserine/homoserine lactone efflux protein